MHVTTIGEFTFSHDGDALRGNVRIQRATWERPVWVPGEVLAQFVANAIRDSRIAALEQATAAELLGVRL